MKANEAPEKIYVTECMLFATNPEITLQGNGNKIEYTRTDAFINKACAFIRERLIFDDDTWYTDGELTLKDKAIEEFKSYMKGETL